MPYSRQPRPICGRQLLLAYLHQCCAVLRCTVDANSQAPEALEHRQSSSKGAKVPVCHSDLQVRQLLLQPCSAFGAGSKPASVKRERSDWSTGHDSQEVIAADYAAQLQFLQADTQQTT